MIRTGFIGGSDCVRILEGDWLNLWQIKTGRAKSEDLSDNIAVQLGSWTEEFNLKWFEKRNGCVLSHHQLPLENIIGNVPVRGTIDAMWGDIDTSSRAIVEAKHTNHFNTMDAVIERYMPQVQLYAKLANADGAYLSVIFGNSKWESAYVSRNEEYFNSMWAVVSDFWGYVLRDQEPIGVDTPQISIDKIPVDQMVKRDASHDNEFISRAHDYIQNKDAAKAFDTAKSDLKAMVGDNEREVYCDLLTIKRSKSGSLLFTVR
jgi:predicted phage-related endonuclease